MDTAGDTEAWLIDHVTIIEVLDGMRHFRLLTVTIRIDHLLN